MINKQYIVLLSFFMFLLFTSELSAEGRVRSDVYESGAPTFNDIEIPMIKDNQLSRWIGDDRIKANLYLGQYAVYDDNVLLSKHGKKYGVGWANVAGGRFSFAQPDFFDISIRPHVIYIPFGKELESFYSNLNVSGNLKINEMIKTGFTTGFDYFDDEYEDSNYTNFYVTNYIDFTPVESFGLLVDGKFYTLRNDVVGTDWDNFNAWTVSAMPYWKFETGKLGVRYTHGNKYFQQSEEGDVAWDEVSLVGEKELSERWKVTGDVGFQNRRYTKDDDLNTVTGSLGIEFRPTDKVVLNLTGARRAFDSSSYSNFEISNTLVFDSAADAAFGVANNDTQAAYYGVANTVGLSGTYSPIVPLKLGAGVSAGYINEHRASDYGLVRTSLSAVYNINEYTSIGASYIFRYDSDSDHGYTDNIVTLGVSFAF